MYHKIKLILDVYINIVYKYKTNYRLWIIMFFYKNLVKIFDSKFSCDFRDSITVLVAKSVIPGFNASETTDYNSWYGFFWL